MLAIAYLSLVILVAIAVLLHLKIAPAEQSICNPAFVSFQSTYFGAYFVALFAEWLQSPYLYRIYSHYGFIDTQIAIIYVCGFVSSILFGTASGYLADRCGRKKACVFFCLTYSLCCLSKASSSYVVLIIGRVLGGISTSVLFSTFEAWYVYEHTQTHDFPIEWITVTFSKASFFNGVIAITAGVIANTLAEWVNLGPVSPFLLAIPFLLAAGILMVTNWEENYGGKSLKLVTPCLESLRLIVTNSKILLIGIVTSLFESVMFVFVFLWTPVLDPAKPPLGIVFSCFMACVMIGGLLFEAAVARKVSPVRVIAVAILLGLASNLTSSFGSSNHPRKTFLAFLLMEFGCGLYFPAMNWVRRRVLPEAHHAGIINWFRVPLNVIASIVLLVLHDTHSGEGITAIFALCSALMTVAAICSIKLMMSLKESDLVSDAQGNESPVEENLI
ncbi:molybdate-anion transporter-like [Dendronephthya gigantea]|uniref:molybdate-anion transporter-like n=1 Tax=Dendronephthya gigantea TaxID=151771 RepID=UPI00106CFF9B|nr:molybdate-anion transporter-like [Dendronephthya gigantea]